MRHGPEYMPGWQHTLDIEGREVTVTARHANVSRMPRGHEIARMASRGRPFSMVSESQHSWMVHGQGIQSATIRENPNGTFSVGAFHPVYRSVVEAAESWSRRFIKAREHDAGEPGGPRP